MTVESIASVPLHCESDFSAELMLGERPLLHSELEGDLLELARETYAQGVLAGELPLEARDFEVHIAPRGAAGGRIRAIEVTVRETRAGSSRCARRRFARGPWSRRLLAARASLEEAGRPPLEGPFHVALCATPARRSSRQPRLLPPFEPLPIVDGSLAEAGVRQLSPARLQADRPVLVNERLRRDVIAATLAAGAVETGGAVLGRLLRLVEPLPGTRTRIVTLLSAAFADERHAGQLASLAFSPEALAEADWMAQQRELGEQVLTAFHSHGWGSDCGRCNESASCPLPNCRDLSLDDYVVLDSLFPGKASLLPVAGRLLGAGGREPVLLIHAWRGGCMQPIPYGGYLD